jgi:hypothetical protein
MGRHNTLSDRLRPPGPKMHLVPPLTGRRIVTGPSAATETRRIFVPGMRRGGRYAGRTK